jgi:hypothetical protein
MLLDALLLVGSLPRQTQRLVMTAFGVGDPG